MSDCIGTGCKAASLMERIAALEAERDCANARADTHLADAYSMRDQRDALREPTETMIVAGVKTLMTGHDSQRHYVGALWRRMFDAAKEK